VSKCIALLSGGLDSMLAIRLMQEQGIEVEALNFRTLFTCCQDNAARAAQALGVSLTVLGADDDYLSLIRRPEFGYGRAANPCIDCRIYMFRKAKTYMEQVGAEFVISGEIVGQRPKSQKRRDLQIIAHQAHLDDHLLRPLCAQRLPPTWPERTGIVDRQQLQDFTGRSRKGLIRLARRFGFSEIPAPSSGCQLTEPRFSRKVFDLLAHETDAERWDFELLKYGRHYRWAPQTKLIVGRNEADNLALTHLQQRDPRQAATLLCPVNFRGAVVLIVGQTDEPALRAACGLLLRHSKISDAEPPQVEVRQHGTQQLRIAQPDASAETLTNLSLVRTRC
jgi:tRNA-uridine 2-sulfurtransferase